MLREKWFLREAHAHRLLQGGQKFRPARTALFVDKLQSSHNVFRFAGSELSDKAVESPENRMTLNISVGRRFPIRSSSSFLDVSNGNPLIEPETSTTKMYSRGGISFAATRFGGCAM